MREGKEGRREKLVVDVIVVMAVIGERGGNLIAWKFGDAVPRVNPYTAVVLDLGGTNAPPVNFWTCCYTVLFAPSVHGVVTGAT